MNSHGIDRRRKKVRHKIFQELPVVKWDDLYVGMKIADKYGDEGIIQEITKDGNALIEWEYYNVDQSLEMIEENGDLDDYDRFDYVLDEEFSYTIFENYGEHKHYNLNDVRPMEKRTKDTKIARKVHGIPDKVENGYLIYDIKS